MSEELEREIIYKCLTPCAECTGRYVSDVLEKRLICRCLCHRQHKLGSKEREEGTT
jgi:hypothetical protein